MLSEVATVARIKLTPLYPLLQLVLMNVATLGWRGSLLKSENLGLSLSIAAPPQKKHFGVGLALADHCTGKPAALVAPRASTPA